MTDLEKLWKTGEQESEPMSISNMIAIEDRRLRLVRRKTVVSVAASAAFFPVLLYFAVFASTPLLRAGYVLMTAGAALTIVVLWLHDRWQRVPVPAVDSRTHLFDAVRAVDRHIVLLRTSWLWCGTPVFGGGMLVGLEKAAGNTADAALILGACTAAWLLSWHSVRRRQVRDLLDYRARLTAALAP